MATHRIPITGFGMVPGSSGDVFFETYDIKATNDVWDFLVAIFNNSGNRDDLHGRFNVPTIDIPTMPRSAMLLSGGGWNSNALPANVKQDNRWQFVRRTRQIPPSSSTTHERSIHQQWAH